MASSRAFFSSHSRRAFGVAAAAIGVPAALPLVAPSFWALSDAPPAEREKLLREARNAPKTIDKIERALAVLEEDVAAIDARLLKCGADVAAAQEVQREKDAKTAKQDLYMAEWERLEGVMEQAELILAEEA